MKLSIETMLGLQAGLTALDVQYDKVIEDGKNSKKVVQARYDFTKKVRIENGMRLHALQEPLKQYQKIRDELVNRHGDANGEEFKVPAKNMRAYNKENQEALAAEIDVEIPELNFDDLKLDENPIPGSVLALLEPIKAGS